MSYEPAHLRYQYSDPEKLRSSRSGGLYVQSDAVALPFGDAEFERVTARPGSA